MPLLPHWGQHNRKEAQLSTDPTTPAPTDSAFVPDPEPPVVPTEVAPPVAPAPAEAPPASTQAAPADPAPTEAVTPVVDARSPFEREQTAAAEAAPETAATPATATPATESQSSTSLGVVMNRDLSTIFQDVDATELGKRVLSFFQHVVGYVEDAKSIMDLLNKK